MKQSGKVPAVGLATLLLFFATICAVLAFTSCSSLQVEKYKLSDETQGARLSYEDLSTHTPVVGDSVMFWVDAKNLGTILHKTELYGFILYIAHCVPMLNYMIVKLTRN
jgi:hypothetical protein